MRLKKRFELLNDIKDSTARIAALMYSRQNTTDPDELARIDRKIAATQRRFQNAETAYAAISGGNLHYV